MADLQPSQEDLGEAPKMGVKVTFDKTGIHVDASGAHLTERTITWGELFANMKYLGITEVRDGGHS
jgi:hypothetical protein